MINILIQLYYCCQWSTDGYSSVSTLTVVGDQQIGTILFQHLLLLVVNKLIQFCCNIYCCRWWTDGYSSVVTLTVVGDQQTGRALTLLLVINRSIQFCLTLTVVSDQHTDTGLLLWSVINRWVQFCFNTYCCWWSTDRYNSVSTLTDQQTDTVLL